jgi:hypothetical protein
MANRWFNRSRYPTDMEWGRSQQGRFASPDEKRQEKRRVSSYYQGDRVFIVVVMISLLVAGSFVIHQRFIKSEQPEIVNTPAPTGPFVEGQVLTAEQLNDMYNRIHALEEHCGRRQTDTD